MIPDIKSLCNRYVIEKGYISLRNEKIIVILKVI